jgi:hypothetical protein
MTEWLKLMLEEIARKQAERDRGLAEASRRAEERGAAQREQPGTQPQPPKPRRTSDP